MSPWAEKTVKEMRDYLENKGDYKKNGYRYTQSRYEDYAFLDHKNQKKALLILLNDPVRPTDLGIHQKDSNYQGESRLPDDIAAAHKNKKW